MKMLKILSIALCILILNVSRVPHSESGTDRQAIIPTGNFVMGGDYCVEEQGNADWCRDEVSHNVRLERYRIDKYQVTNREYKQCVEAGICQPNDIHEFRPKDFNKPMQPVVFVSHHDASTYCRWKGGRLPTEAEWERAAEADQLGGAYFGQSYKQGSPRGVGELSPNSNGLYDMMGNVSEWTRDWYGPYDLKSVHVNPQGPPEGKEKVVRGGSWNSPAHFLRTSDRVARSPERRFSDVGFRCAGSLE